MRPQFAILALLLACNGRQSEVLPGTGVGSTGSGSGLGTGEATTEELPRWNGTLDDAGARILGELQAGRDTEAFHDLDPAGFAAFEQVAGDLALGQLGIADAVEAQGYEAGIVVDTENDRDVVVVWERDPALHRGALVVALGPARPVVIESPHGQFDGKTGEEGLDLFVSLQARAWIVNTAHRCANAAFSDCDGQSPVCGNGQEPYHVSDAAHFTESAFQAWHQGLLDADPALVAVQNHGFAHDGTEPEAYLSTGSAQPDGPDALSTRLAAVLDEVLPHGAASCQDPADAEIARFCATTNTQGRHANGSAEPCATPPTATSDRFLHVEQSWELRNLDGPVNRQLIIDALAEVLPPPG